MAALTEAYKTLQACGAGGGFAAASRPAGVDAAAGGGVGPGGKFAFDNSCAAEPDNSPEAQARREAAFESMWLPWQKHRRRPGVSPIAKFFSDAAARPAARAADTSSSATQQQQQQQPSRRASFVNRFVPLGAVRLLFTTAIAVRERGQRLISAAKYVVCGKA